MIARVKTRSSPSSQRKGQILSALESKEFLQGVLLTEVCLSHPHQEIVPDFTKRLWLKTKDLPLKCSGVGKALWEPANGSWKMEC